MQVGAGCVFRDRLGRILLVKPTYKEEWELPGGAAEEGESPLRTCQREIKEELGLELVPECLVAIDYREPIPDRRGSALRFVFSGGVLDEAEVEAIRLDSTELSDFRFVSIDELSSHDTPVMARRLRSIIESQTSGLLYLETSGLLYLEEGRVVLG
jgi:8-oxo-dGTP diphosphatase